MTQSAEGRPAWGSPDGEVAPAGPEPGAPGTWDAGTETERVRAAAVQRLHKRRDFRTHLFSYLLVNGGLVAIWVVTSFTGGLNFFWPVFPMLGWGIGLGFHAWDVYGPPSRPIDQAAIDREIERMQRR